MHLYVRAKWSQRLRYRMYFIRHGHKLCSIGRQLAFLAGSKRDQLCLYAIFVGGCQRHTELCAGQQLDHGQRADLRAGFKLRHSLVGIGERGLIGKLSQSRSEGHQWNYAFRTGHRAAQEYDRKRGSFDCSCRDRLCCSQCQYQGEWADMRTGGQLLHYCGIRANHVSLFPLLKSRIKSLRRLVFLSCGR